jgi:hypothetical protein
MNTTPAPLTAAQTKALSALARLETVTATTAPHRGAIRIHVLLSLVELGLAIQVAPNTFKAADK